MAEKEAIKLFGHYYTVACRQYADGDIKDIVQAIAEKPEPHPVDKTRSADARLRAMEAIRGFGIGIKQMPIKQ